MGKRRVQVITVRKPVTFALLVLTSAAMAGLLYLLSGRAYAGDTHPVRELLARLFGSGRADVSRDTILAFLMPVIAHVLLFVPWGFLAFLWLDSPARSRPQTYALAVTAAVLFAVGVHLGQLFLPTRVTSIYDTFANALGAFGGAALGHARKGVRVRFDF